MIAIMKILMWVAVSGVLLMLLIDFYMRHTVSKYITTLETLTSQKEEQAGGTAAQPVNQMKEADAALVLGAQVKADGSMSKMLTERVDMGIALYQAGVVKKIIMSGDHGRAEYDEVNTMKDYAVAQVVPSEDIFMDHAGFSTYESMYRAKEIFQVDSMVVVTQQYHLYRALYDGLAFDMEVKGVPCDTAVYHGDTYRKLRELLARCKDFTYTLVKPEPTYLGEAIPVSGNGDVTNDRSRVLDLE